MNYKLPEYIETDRLYIRQAKVEDNDVVFEALMESFDEFSKWLFWVNSKYSREGSLSALSDAYKKYLENNELLGLIFLKDTHELVGSVGLHNIKWDLNQFEAGYWCRKSMQGLGFMPEAVNALVDFTFNHLGARRICLTTDEENIASQKLAQKCEFIYEGTLHKDSLGADGNLRNTQVYAKWR
jgi:RimJ/RimL family protein N-acetyltransferase